MPNKIEPILVNNLPVEYASAREDMGIDMDTQNSSEPYTFHDPDVILPQTNFEKERSNSIVFKSFLVTNDARSRAPNEEDPNNPNTNPNDIKNKPHSPTLDEMVAQLNPSSANPTPKPGTAGLPTTSSNPNSNPNSNPDHNHTSTLREAATQAFSLATKTSSAISHLHLRRTPEELEKREHDRVFRQDSQRTKLGIIAHANADDNVVKKFRLRSTSVIGDSMNEAVKLQEETDIHKKLAAQKIIYEKNLWLWKWEILLAGMLVLQMIYTPVFIAYLGR